MSDYIAHFGLKKAPFSTTPDPAFAFATREHRRRWPRSRTTPRNAAGSSSYSERWERAKPPSLNSPSTAGGRSRTASSPAHVTDPSPRTPGRVSPAGPRVVRPPHDAQPAGPEGRVPRVPGRAVQGRPHRRPADRRGPDDLPRQSRFPASDGERTDPDREALAGRPARPAELRVQVDAEAGPPLPHRRRHDAQLADRPTKPSICFTTGSPLRAATSTASSRRKRTSRSTTRPTASPATSASSPMRHFSTRSHSTARGWMWKPSTAH